MVKSKFGFKAPRAVDVAVMVCVVCAASLAVAEFISWLSKPW